MKVVCKLVNFKFDFQYNNMTAPKSVEFKANFSHSHGADQRPVQTHCGPSRVVKHRLVSTTKRNYVRSDSAPNSGHSLTMIRKSQ